MIEVRGLNKKFGKKQVLSNISVKLEPGVYGLLGSNGAGKTTLLRCLTMLYREGGDAVFYRGKPIKNQTEYFSKVGYLPQKFGLFHGLSVRDMLLLLAKLKKVKESEAREQIEANLRLTNLSDKIEDKVGTLSGGMLRRLGIAQALLGDLEFVYFDEPTSGLDPEERLRFKNIVTEIKDDKTILISTHIVADLDSVADKVIVLHEGEILFIGTCADLKQKADGSVYEIAEKHEPELVGSYFVFRRFERDGEYFIRLLSREQQEFAQVPPTIEDGYLLLIKGI